MDTTGWGEPVDYPFTFDAGKTEFVVTDKAIIKTKGLFLFRIPAGTRKYDVYVAMFRAAIDTGVMYLNEIEWEKAALAVMRNGSHWLKDYFLYYFPNTYNYNRR
jgi:hypothetical protein